MPCASACWNGGTPWPISISMGPEIDTCPPVDAIRRHSSSLRLSQWMYVQSDFMAGAIGTSVPAPFTWSVIGEPTSRASAQSDALVVVAIASVSSWSLDEKYCVRSRRMSPGN